MTDRDLEQTVEKEMKAFPFGSNTRYSISFRNSTERSVAYFYISAYKASPDFSDCKLWLEANLNSKLNELSSPKQDEFLAFGRPNATLLTWNETVIIAGWNVKTICKIKYCSLLRINNSTFHFLLNFDT